MNKVRRFYQRHALLMLKEKASRAVAACRAFAPFGDGEERGQTLLEFAFVAPIILVFLLAMIDFGIAVDRREVLQHAVREGARHGAIGQDVASIQDYTSDQSQGVLDPADVTVCYVDANGDGVVGNVGDNVKVSADFTYKFSVGSFELLGAFGVDQSDLTINMTPSGDMRMETTVAGAVACT